MSYEYFHNKFLGVQDECIKRILTDGNPHSFIEHVNTVCFPHEGLFCSNDNFTHEYHTIDLKTITSNQVVTECLRRGGLPRILCSAELILLEGTTNYIEYIDLTIGGISIHKRLNIDDLKIFNKLHNKLHKNNITTTTIPIICELMLLQYHQLNLEICVKPEKQINATIKIHQIVVNDNEKLLALNNIMSESIIIQNTQIEFTKQNNGYHSTLPYVNHPVFMLCLHGKNKTTIKRITIILDGETFYDRLFENEISDEPFFIFMHEPQPNQIPVNTIFNNFKTSPTINFSRVNEPIMFIETNDIITNLRVVAYNKNILRGMHYMAGIMYAF